MPIIDDRDPQLAATRRAQQTLRGALALALAGDPRAADAAADARADLDRARRTTPQAARARSTAPPLPA